MFGSSHYWLWELLVGNEVNADALLELVVKWTGKGCSLLLSVSVTVKLTFSLTVVGRSTCKKDWTMI